MQRRLPFFVLAVLCSACGSSGDATSPGDDATNGVDSGADGSTGDTSDADADARASDAGDASRDGDAHDTSDDADAAPPKPLLGVFCGNDATCVAQFEGWLGKDVDGVLGYTGHASWDDFDGSVGWAVGVWAPINRRVLWSVPLIPTGATLDDAATGAYDAHYTKAAKTLSTFRPSDAQIYVRTGWELNGNWFPWTAQGHATAYQGAFRHFVEAFRAVSPRFVFEWNVNVGDVGMNREDAYPGDAYVDIIGMDCYWNTDFDPTDPEAAWTLKRTEKYGLEWHQSFAATHHKPTAYSEWGIRSNGAGPYIAHMADWFSSHPVVYQTYWNSNSNFPGMLSNGQYPTAGAAYRKAFGP